uniref:(California timema) hypothetical protein n=1 Tax=Timema californicum TaxID=61474 RepID=A0A7R9J5R5_TIMCA|nr:unnamed protein product [Timema californicum]
MWSFPRHAPWPVATAAPWKKRVETARGSVLVAVQGNRNKPAILTYHDLGLNCECGRTEQRKLKLSQVAPSEQCGSRWKPFLLYKPVLLPVQVVRIYANYANELGMRKVEFRKCTRICVKEEWKTILERLPLIHPTMIRTLISLYSAVKSNLGVDSLDHSATEAVGLFTICGGAPNSLPAGVMAPDDPQVCCSQEVDISSFQAFFNYIDMRALLENFCVYHVNAPGQEEGATTLPEE